MQSLSLNVASKMVDLVIEKARELNCKPLTITVLDAGGNPLVLMRQDGSGILRPQISHAKAWGALGMGLGGRTLADRAVAAPAFFAALTGISEGRMAPVPGGVLIRDGDGNLLGAIGISGDHPDKDEACAGFAVSSAGFVPDGG
jgi:uncharacterized protein GlcG (DUF336 family)